MLNNVACDQKKSVNEEKHARVATETSAYVQACNQLTSGGSGSGRGGVSSSDLSAISLADCGIRDRLQLGAELRLNLAPHEIEKSWE